MNSPKSYRKSVEEQRNESTSPESLPTILATFFPLKTNLMLEFKFLGVLQVSLGVQLHTFSKATVNFLQSSSDSESGKIK